MFDARRSLNSTQTIKTNEIGASVPDAPPTTRRIGGESAAFWVVLTLAFVVRGGVLFSSLSTFDADPDDYRRLAENWYSFGVFGTETTATAFRPPLYPWSLKTLISLRASSERPERFENVPGSARRVKTDRQKLDKTNQLEEVNKTGVIDRRFADFSELDDSKSAAKRTFFDRYLALSPNASIAFWHWLLGVATVAVVYRIGRKLDFGPKLSAFAAFGVAVDPILLQQSRLVMTETFAAFFAATAIWGTLAAVERRGSKISFVYFGAFGLWFGLSTLCRPAFFAFAGLVFLNLAAIEIWDVVKNRNGNARSSLDEPYFDCSQPVRANGAGRFPLLRLPVYRLAAFLLGIAVAVAPWAARNYREFGRPILTTTHGGYTLYLANNRQLYEHYRTTPPWTLWNPNEFHRARTVEYAAALEAAKIAPNGKDAELFQNAWTRAEAQAAIRAEPTTFVRAVAIRIGELWRAFPNNVAKGTSESARFSAASRAIGAFYVVQFAFVAVGIVSLLRRRFVKIGKREINGVDAAFTTDVVFKSRWIWGFLLIASVQIPHLLYWTNMRMRAPLEVFLPLLALAVFARRAASTAPRRPRPSQYRPTTYRLSATRKVKGSNR